MVCQETHRSYRVHAMVLLAMSNMLMVSMDHQDNQEDQEMAPADDEVRRLRLPYKEKTIEALIKTAYEGAEMVTFDVKDEEGLIDLIRAASHYHIPDLKQHVATLMLAGCTPDTMVDLHRTAKLFSPADEAFQLLKSNITSFTAKNIAQVISSKSFLSFSVEDMKDLLGNRHLQLTREEAEGFLSSWFSQNTVVRNTTRLTKASLTALAKRPTTYRIPSSVLLTAGGWASDPTNLMEVFNLLDNSWSVSTLTLPGTSRAYHGMEILDGSIWAVGGFSQREGFLNSVQEYKLPAGPWVTRSSMAVKRCYVETQLLEGKIYAMGGHSGGAAVERLRSAEVYTVSANQWDPVAAMVHQRSDFASVVLNGAIYVLGGFQGVHYQTSIEKYEPREDRWTVVGHLAGPRSGSTAVAANGRIYVLGGFNGSERLASVESFSPGLVGLVRHEVPDMLHHRSNFCALLVDPNTIMVSQSVTRALSCISIHVIKVAGGFKKDPEDDQGEIYGGVELLDLEKKVWRPAPPLTVPRSALKAIQVKDFYG